MENILEQIINKFNNKPFKETQLTDNELLYLKNRYNDSLSLKESYWRLKYNIEKRPICPICNKPLKFIGKTHRIFDKTCSKQCAMKLKSIKLQEQYGEHITNQFQLEYIKDKSRKTCLEKYGSEYALLNDHIKEKQKQTCLEKYGVENVFQSDEIKEKIYKSNKEKYGNEHITTNKVISDKIRETRLLKNNYSHSEETKQKISLTLLTLDLHHTVTQEQIEKTKQTCLAKYGETCYAKTKLFREYFSSDEYQQELLKKKKANKTTNSSKPEKIAYEMLKEKFPNTIQQYRSELYPFNCDFYIPEIDTYIECNFYWTHGNHQFNENDPDDINKLNIWKEKAKTSNHYKTAINNWTIRDIKKINTAIENKLNYFFPYTMDLFKKIIEKL